MTRRSTLLFLTCLTTLGTTLAHVRGNAIAQVSSSSQLSANRFTVAQLDEPATIEDDFGELDSASNVLSIGSEGPAVIALQTRLQDIGYYDGRIDGIYGLGTQRAVRAFQESQGFSVTGRLDNGTWDAIEAFDLAGEGALGESGEFASSDDVPAVVSESDGSRQPSAVTDGALPPVTEGADAIEGTIEGNSAAEKGNGLGRLFALGLGLSALVASFGVGFFIANKGKEDAEAGEGGWSEVNPAGVLGVPVGPSGGMDGAAVNGNGYTGSAIATAGNGAIQTNGQMGGTSALAPVDVVDGLIKDLHNPDPSKRRKVIWELGQRGHSLAVKPLVDAMVDADSKEKSLVLAALSEIGIRSLKPMNRALAIAMQDENPEVRKNAIRDITRVYDLVVQISHMLGHATEDEDPEVRQTATWALDQLNRTRRTQDLDTNMRAFPGGAAKPIDLLSSEASIRRSQS
ncbi:MAG: peptidoglycan-binding protein [Cyanobacteria bacterium J06627_28]